MKVIDRIAAAVADSARSARVADVRLGLGYTAVRLEDGWTGVAMTVRDDDTRGCHVFRGLRPLAGRPATHLLDLITSADKLEATVGLACANALSNRPHARLQEGDILERLDIRPGDHVGMVGYFGPLVKSLKQSARQLTIFERSTGHPDQTLPADQAPELLPQCQVAIITATAILTGTIDELLAACASCRSIAIVGASTPLSPQVYANTPATLLSGVVTNNPEILQVVSEGGGMRQFKHAVRKVSCQCPAP